MEDEYLYNLLRVGREWNRGEAGKSKGKIIIYLLTQQT